MVSEGRWMLELLEKEWIWKCKGSVVKAAGVETLSLHKLEQSLICCNYVHMETRIYTRGWFHKISNHGFTCTSRNFTFGTCYFILLAISEENIWAKTHHSFVISFAFSVLDMEVTHVKAIKQQQILIQKLTCKVRFFETCVPSLVHLCFFLKIAFQEYFPFGLAPSELHIERVSVVSSMGGTVRA